MTARLGSFSADVTSLVSTGIAAAIPVGLGVLIGGTSTAGTTTPVSIGTGLTVTAGSLALALGVVSTYTASGAIAVSDAFSVINSASNLAMTLAAGTVDQHFIRIKRYGAGSVSITGTIDGVYQTINMTTTQSIKETLTLVWLSSLSSYIME